MRGEIDLNVIGPLINSSISKDLSKDKIASMLRISNIVEYEDMTQVISDILLGNAGIFVEGLEYAFSVDVKGWGTRAISVPESEAVVRGSKEGFVEGININIMLLRKRIRNPNLVFESMKIGRQTHTPISICYIDGIVNKAILEEVRNRLKKIDTDAILESGYIEQYIEDNPSSPFSTIGNTQKPDIVAAKILEGRVAIICDGTPHVLTIPYLFVEGLQTSEDYYGRPFYASMLRIFRIMALFFAMVFPAFYVALVTFHQDMIPTVLIISMIGSHESIPFPAFVEALIMLLAFEFLRESGTRLPRAIGSAISIVGALILGEAAVNAGFVSPDLVIIIAFTAVSTFIVPSFADAISFYRIILLVAAALMGLSGVAITCFMILMHMVSLRSFGVPFMSPLTPTDPSGLKDTIIRFPLWSMKKRPASISQENIIRQNDSMRK